MTKEKIELPNYYDFRKPEFQSKKEKVERNCMMCNKLFMSEGIKNRICNPCKQTDDWQYGNDYKVVE